jgi:hypothetical protein
LTAQTAFATERHESTLMALLCSSECLA